MAVTVTLIPGPCNAPEGPSSIRGAHLDSRTPAQRTELTRIDPQQSSLSIRMHCDQYMGHSGCPSTSVTPGSSTHVPWASGALLSCFTWWALEQMLSYLRPLEVSSGDPPVVGEGTSQQGAMASC